MTDQELLQEAKKSQKAAIWNAVLIGVLIGIVVYSVVKNGFGFFILIPLFFVYRMINSSKHSKKELDDLLRERNLKF